MKKYLFGLLLISSIATADYLKEGRRYNLERKDYRCLFFRSDYYLWKSNRILFRIGNKKGFIQSNCKAVRPFYLYIQQQRVCVGQTIKPIVGGKQYTCQIRRIKSNDF
jgi:hypothetical protein